PVRASPDAARGAHTHSGRRGDRAGGSVPAAGPVAGPLLRGPRVDGLASSVSAPPPHAPPHRRCGPKRAQDVSGAPAGAETGRRGGGSAAHRVSRFSRGLTRALE